MLTPGAHVDRYELVCPIGEGGMAEVWVARQRGKHGFEKLFALKSIHPRFAADPAFRAMFLDEARIVAAIEHPNVAQVFDLGETGALLYLVMEYVDGESLSALLASAAKARGLATATVPVPIALRIARDLCAGLHAAHGLTDRSGRPRGVVHRDVSPHNVLVSVRGDVKLIDFGIAHARDRAAGDTAVGSLKGKVNYMAPEQARRQPLGPYTDVFGAGATLYRMLAGRAPFDGGGEAATLAQLVSGAPPPPLPETVPPMVRAIVLRALAHDPAARYASALEMASALEGALAHDGLAPDVAAWANDNLSERARARRAELAATAGAPDLELPPRIASATAATTPVEEEEEPAPPGFMDVRALVARGGAAPAASSAPGAEVDGDDDAPAKPKPFSPAVVGATGPAACSRLSGKALAIGGAIVLALLAVVALAGPGFVRDRVIARARDAGVELEIGSSAVGLGGITLHDVRARIPRLPEVGPLRCDDIEIVGLTGGEVRVKNLDATVTGPLVDVSRKMLAFAEDGRRAVAGTPGSPRTFTVVSGRFTWREPFGEGTEIQGGPVGVDVESRGAGLEEVRASIARFDVKTPRSTLGPWGAAWERDATTSRGRVLFDPPLMDGPSALVVLTQPGAMELTVRVPRSPFQNLGVRPKELGLPADSASELEALVEVKKDADGKIAGTMTADLWSARLPNVNGPIDLHASGGVSGVAGKPLAIDEGKVTVGPFVAGVTGTIVPYDAGLRLDARWRTEPIACATLVRAEASKMGPIVEAIQDIAHRTGAARVTGTANAAGLVHWDTKSPGDLPVTWTARETCGVSLFGL